MKTTSSAPSSLHRDTDPASLARLRAHLLHVEDVPSAITAVSAFLVEHVGPTEVLPSDAMQDVEAESSRRTPLETAPPSLRSWMMARGSREAIVVPIRSAPSQLAVVDLTAHPDDSVVREVARDLNRSIDLVAALGEKKALARALSEKEGLLEHTTAALFRDAGEVVRVLGALERRDATMKQELHRALRFQRAMISPLPAHEHVVFDALYLAADVISADFYDVAVVTPEHVRIFVADATGHGIAAGLATMFVKAEYEAQKRVCPTSASLIAAMNDGLTSRYETLDLRCTALCIDLFPSKRTLHFTSAAHPGPAIVRARATEFFPGGNTFMGLQAGAAFTTVETTLEAGDLVIAFTDGLFDACAADGSTFGRKHFEPIALEARDRPDQFGAVLVSGLSSFVGDGRALLDDVTAVAVALKRPRSD